MCWKEESGEEKTEQVPLTQLIPDEDDPNSQYMEDYRHWGMERSMTTSDDEEEEDEEYLDDVGDEEDEDEEDEDWDEEDEGHRV